jgi:hypothetical protein
VCGKDIDADAGDPPDTCPECDALLSNTELRTDEPASSPRKRKRKQQSPAGDVFWTPAQIGIAVVVVLFVAAGMAGGLWWLLARPTASDGSGVDTHTPITVVTKRTMPETEPSAESKYERIWGRPMPETIKRSLPKPEPGPKPKGREDALLLDSCKLTASDDARI